MSPATVSRLESGDRKGYGEIQALMYALLDTGARCTKLVTSTLDDPRDDCIPLRQTKGKRPRVVPLGRNTEQAIYRYLQRGRASLRPKSKALFVANNGGLLSRNAVRCVFHRLGDTLGFPISAHRFRHTWATMLMRKGVDLEILRKWGGWADYDMLKIYSHLDTEDLKRARERYSIVDGL